METKENDSSFYYEQTLCVGEYKANLAADAKRMSMELKKFSIKTFNDDEETSKSLFERLKLTLYKWLGQDWLFLLCLAIFVGLCAFAMDTAVTNLRQIHYTLLNITGNIQWSVQYITWIGFSLILILFSILFCRFVAPQATGSGIPEMKTILRGVVLREYLSLRTLVSKVIGLTAALSSGLPIGKEGPLVHIASIFGMLTSKMIRTFNVYYMNESRRAEMLAAACAVGVASCFGAPVGGVLFSIEGTTSYFAVRNYWRGFFAATWATVVYQFLSILTSAATTFSPFYPTYFDPNNAFDPIEIFLYSIVGLICGLGGPLFVLIHRKIILNIRNNVYLKKFFTLNQYIYPIIVTVVVMTAAFPPASGRFMESSLTTKTAINDLFANFTWTEKNLSSSQVSMVSAWMPYGLSIYITLLLFIVYYILGAALSNTIPIPAGVFVPVFVIGAACGRMFGEGLAQLFPMGLRKNKEFLIRPGSYALVGAAAFAGSVTHTISTAIITFEMTGQVIYLVPVMLGVLISNAVAAFLQPSIYDSIIQIRKLPYLPDIKRTTSRIYTMLVEDFMVKNVQYITVRTTYRELQHLLQTSHVKAYPVVDRPSSMILLGLMPRLQLEEVLKDHLEKSNDKPKKENIGRRLSRYSLSFSKPDTIERTNSSSPTTKNCSSSVNESKMPKKRLLSLPSLKVVSRKRTIRKHISFQVNSEIDPLDEVVDFTKMEMDPAPIQLVEKTPLAKVHILFSLLRLHQVYVTRLGRLVGVVSINELRDALLKSSKNFRRSLKNKQLSPPPNSHRKTPTIEIPRLSIVSEAGDMYLDSSPTEENVETQKNHLNVPESSNRNRLSSEGSDGSWTSDISIPSAASSIIEEDDSDHVRFAENDFSDTSNGQKDEKVDKFY